MVEKAGMNLTLSQTPKTGLSRRGPNGIVSDYNKLPAKPQLLFVSGSAFHPSQQFFSHVWTTSNRLLSEHVPGLTLPLAIVAICY